MKEENKKEVQRDLINTSLRITESRNNYIKEKASEIGISQNAFTNVLIDLGIRLYELNLEDVLSHNLRYQLK